MYFLFLLSVKACYKFTYVSVCATIHFRGSTCLSVCALSPTVLYCVYTLCWHFLVNIV